MNKTELVAAVAEKAGAFQEGRRGAVKALTDV